MKYNKHLFFLFILLCQVTFSQITIKGVVNDAQGLPLPSATVLEKGTKNGFSTNFDGEYVIQVSNTSAVLVFSYVGFKDKEVPVKDQKIIN